MALKLLLVPHEQSPWHRGDVLESGLFQLCSLMFFVLLSLFLFFLSEAFVGLIGAALSVMLVLCPVIHLGFKCQIPQSFLLLLSCSHHSCHGLSMHFINSVVVWWLSCSHRKKEKPPGGKWDREVPAGFWHTQPRLAVPL